MYVHTHSYVHAYNPQKQTAIAENYASLLFNNLQSNKQQLQQHDTSANLRIKQQATCVHTNIRLGYHKHQHTYIIHIFPYIHVCICNMNTNCQIKTRCTLLRKHTRKNRLRKR